MSIGITGVSNDFQFNVAYQSKCEVERKQESGISFYSECWGVAKRFPDEIKMTEEKSNGLKTVISI